MLLDPDGRGIVLDALGWRHIVARHPEVALLRETIVETVVKPDVREPDYRPGWELYHRRGVGPSRWFVVVVDFGAQSPRVVTAFGSRRAPRGVTR